jgi:hypothetical protein
MASFDDHAGGKKNLGLGVRQDSFVLIVVLVLVLGATSTLTFLLPCVLFLSLRSLRLNKNEIAAP